MITLTAVLARLPSLDEGRLRFWVAQEWVRAERRGGEVVFAEIDVARVHLIADLEALEVGEAAMPVVLSLLDQLHDTRRQMRRLVATLDDEAAARAVRRVRGE